jgi:hypothetical protein
MKTMICLENMSFASFSNEVIDEINNYTEKSNEELCIASFDETMPFRNINTAVFSPNEIDSFKDGLIICSNLKIANSILGCANNSKKVLYLYDLDWMFQPMLYDQVYKILNSPDLLLILRSEDHLSPVNNISNREPDAIINKFNLEKIWNLL